MLSSQKTARESSFPSMSSFLVSPIANHNIKLLAVVRSAGVKGSVIGLVSTKDTCINALDLQVAVRVEHNGEDGVIRHWEGLDQIDQSLDLGSPFLFRDTSHKVPANWPLGSVTCDEGRSCSPF